MTRAELEKIQEQLGKQYDAEMSRMIPGRNKLLRTTAGDAYRDGLRTMLRILMEKGVVRMAEPIESVDNPE